MFFLGCGFDRFVFFFNWDVFIFRLFLSRCCRWRCFFAIEIPPILDLFPWHLELGCSWIFRPVIIIIIKSKVVCSAYKGGALCGLCAAPGSSELPMLFATFGVQHIKFWQTPRSGRLSQAIEGRRGAFGTEGPKIIVCAVWVARDRLVAGGNNGDVDLIVDEFCLCFNIYFVFMFWCFVHSFISINSQQNFSGEIFFFHGSRAVRKMEPQVSPVACLLPMRDTLAVAPWSSVFKACLNTTLCWVVVTQIFF